MKFSFHFAAWSIQKQIGKNWTNRNTRIANGLYERRKKKTVEYIASAAIKNIYICGVVEMLRDLCSTSNWCCTFLSWTQMDMIKKTCITFCQVISPSDRKKNTRKSCTLLYLTNAFIFVVAKQMDERRKKKKRHETNMTVHL